MKSITLVQYFGAALILNALLFGAFWAATERPFTKSLTGVVVVAVLAGLWLLRGGELKVGDIATLRSQAEMDVSDIRVMKSAIANHADAIEAQATEATNITRRLEEQEAEATKLTQRLEKQELSLNETSKQLKDELAKGAAAVEFIDLVARAQSDDRAAWQELAARGQKDPKAKAAANAAAGEANRTTMLGYPNPFKVDINTVSPNEIVEWFRTGNYPHHIRSGAVSAVVEKKTNLTRSEKIELLIRIHENAESLSVVAKAASALEPFTKIQSLSSIAYRTWWEGNKEKLRAEDAQLAKEKAEAEVSKK